MDMKRNFAKESIITFLTTRSVPKMYRTAKSVCLMVIVSGVAMGRRGESALGKEVWPAPQNIERRLVNLKQP